MMTWMKELMVAPKHAVEEVRFVSDVIVGMLSIVKNIVSKKLINFSSFIHPFPTLSAGDPLDANPPEDEHGAVVVDVEEADLGDLLPQDEKGCIQEFHSFGDVVPPKSRGYLKT